MSDSSLPSSERQVTRGGTIRTANLFGIVQPFVWIVLVNAGFRAVENAQCTVTNENDGNDQYTLAMRFGLTPRTPVPGATYRITIAAFNDADWFRLGTDSRNAALGRLTFCRLKYRARVLDELGLPVALTQVTVTFNDGSTATPSTDGQGMLLMRIDDPETYITGITFADCHESEIGTAVQTNSGTHLAP
jgi:hypothetical protein